MVVAALNIVIVFTFTVYEPTVALAANNDADKKDEIYYGSFAGGGLVSSEKETFTYARKTTESYFINQSFPKYYNANGDLKNTCANVTKYYGSDDIFYCDVEDENVLINDYGIKAYFPKVKADIVNIISSSSDGILNGAVLEYFVYDKIVFNAEFVTISKNCILQKYDSYFNHTNLQKWKNFELKYMSLYNINTFFYNISIHFTDGSYNYFLTVESEEDLQPNEILDFLYK